MARSTQRTDSKVGARRPPKAQQEPEPKRTASQVTWEWLKSLFMGFVLFLVLRTFLIQTFTITSGSMEGTLLVGDFLVLSKSAYGATVPGTDFQLPGYTNIDRGDIIVFRGHHEPIDLVKRVVGMPGDTLAMRDGILFLNGQPQEEPYVRHTDPGGDGMHPWMYWQRDHLVDGIDPATYRPSRDTWGPLVIPSGEYFALGDNRDESLDSRYWGFVPARDIKGKAVALYFSFDHNGGASPFFRAIRWDRIGELLR
jgi:signal peptidase I